tara:strand:- start:6556 stop:6972 length:417 start_codon:yes stop_codon:yes gene_type:complete
MVNQFQINSLAELNLVVDELEQLISTQKIFILYGDLGSGKTTLIKTLLQRLDVQHVNSPTFSIINNYYSSTNGEIYHVDGYRIENEDEVENLGFQDIIDEDCLCFIEWPEKFLNFLPKNYVEIKIKVLDTQRIITLSL